MDMKLPLGTEGRKATHDFLSLYSPSSTHARQDPAPPQGAHLRTHDFLQPLERDGKHDASTKEENKGGGMAAAAKPPMPSHPVSAEHLLPNCVGACSTSYFHQRTPKPERGLFTASQACSTTQTNENSNCSSYTGRSGFTLWDESVDKKGKTGKENVAMERHARRESGGNVVGAQWTSLMERSSPSQSPPPSFQKPNPTTFSSFSSSQLSSSQNDQSFMDLITSAKNELEEDDDDDECTFIIRKGLSSHPEGNLSVKVKSKSVDQKPSTPRSKHSATEQRRRSKINDRFQKLREVIPNSDEKRDKASFLLEVVEYIQFLQEKVNRYESSWNHESSKMIQWRNSHSAEGFIGITRGANTETSSAKLVAARFDKNKANITPSNLMDTGMSSATTLKEKGQQPGSTSIPKSFHPTTQQCSLTFGQASPAAFPLPQQEVSHTDKTVAQSPSQAQQNILSTDNCSGTGQETTTIDSGTINISSTYSQGMLNTLTKALRTSGVDLSHACISVKINLAKRACTSIQHPSTSAAKDVEIPEALPHFKATSLADQALKRLRTS